MEPFFNPKSVVVIGASNAMFNLGATICNLLKNYMSYPGAVYAVNSTGDSVHGYPGYPSVAALPETPDLAVIIVSAPRVPGLIRDCAARGIRHVVIESAGFSEEGENGAAIQAEIDEIARAAGMRLMGPNCLGILSTHDRFCCFYGVNPSLFEMTEVARTPGSISYILQSGGVAVLIVESLYDDMVGINKVVAIGNRCDVDEADVIDYFQGDATEVIGIYLENVGNGRRLMEAAKRSRKPVLLFKAGRTEEGAKAAVSHTAGMAGNDRIFDAACRQAGIIRVQSITELHALPKIFTEMPILRGKRIAAFTSSGAFGSIGADLMVDAGLKMAKLSPSTQERLKKAGQVFNVSNPVDIGPALPQTYLDIFQILLGADEVDGLLTMINMWQPFVVDCLGELIRMCRHYDKPAAIYTPDSITKILSVRAKHGIPIFASLEEAVRALSVSNAFHTSMVKRGLEPSSGPSAGRPDAHRTTEAVS